MTRKHCAWALLLLPALILLGGRAWAGGQEAESEEFEGVYVTAFEASEFYNGLHCPENIPWWLDAEPDSGFFERLNELSPPPAEGREVRFFRVRFTGRLSPPGRYGHLGYLPYLVTVEHLLDAAPAPECAPPRTSAGE
jgi:hypothetical protein